MAFDPKKYLIKVQGNRQYLPVSARMIWFREEHPDWGVETHAIAIDIEKQYAIFEATIYNAEGKLMAKGTKMENVKGFGDYLEKAETGAVGRALALCGYGTQFSPELDEAGHGRIVDSPQPMGGGYRANNYGGGNRPGGYEERSGSYDSRYGNGNSGGGNTANSPSRDGGSNGDSRPRTEYRPSGGEARAEQRPATSLRDERPEPNEIRAPLPSAPLLPTPPVRELRGTFPMGTPPRSAGHLLRRPCRPQRRKTPSMTASMEMRPQKLRFRVQRALVRNRARRAERV